MRVEIPGQGRLLAHFGEDAQSVIHMEECAELIQAISKMDRYGGDAEYENLVEEMADVLICLQQLQMIYEIPDHMIQGLVYQKCARQEARMHESM